MVIVTEVGEAIDEVQRTKREGQREKDKERRTKIMDNRWLRFEIS
jgi:hypothetical protein